ncbi:MAG: 6-phosphogluconolactonase [Waddliaceae bacterium]
MDGYHWKQHVKSLDERRDVVIPGDAAATIEFCADHFFRVAEDAIANHGYFAVALSGGSTPKAIFKKIKQVVSYPPNEKTQKEFRPSIDWKRVMVFWSDERSVPPDHPDSNYKMAMEAGFGSLGISSQQIFRMHGEGDIEKHAMEYEELINKFLPDGVFDLVMLGMGEDGHTASLFPKTHGLHPSHRLVIANYVPKFDTWRMTLTFDCINRARNIVIYVMGKGKAHVLERVLSSAYEPDLYPVQAIGTPANKALLIADNEALSDTSAIES